MTAYLILTLVILAALAAFTYLMHAARDVDDTTRESIRKDNLTSIRNSWYR